MAKRKFKCMFRNRRVGKNDPRDFEVMWILVKECIRTVIVQNEPYLRITEQKEYLDMALEAMATLEQTDFLNRLRLDQRAEEHQKAFAEGEKRRLAWLEAKEKAESVAADPA